MAVSLAVVTTDCVIGLNAGSGYSATVTDPRWTTQQIVDQVLAADGMVVAACIEGQDNPYASGYYSTISGVANGATISSRSVLMSLPLPTQEPAHVKRLILYSG
jgi:hypothetical protein